MYDRSNALSDRVSISVIRCPAGFEEGFSSGRDAVHVHATRLRPFPTGVPVVRDYEVVSVGKGADARLPTVRDEELGRLLGGVGLGAQELQQFGVDFLCMRPRDAVRAPLDDHEARA